MVQHEHDMWRAVDVNALTFSLKCKDCSLSFTEKQLDEWQYQQTAIKCGRQLQNHSELAKDPEIHAFLLSRSQS